LCGYLPIDTMIRFEHGPIMWSGLTRVNAAILLTGENRSLQQDGASFKNWPLAKIRCFALMNSAY